MHFAMEFFKKCAKTFIFDVQSFITNLSDWGKFLTIRKINLIDLFLLLCLSLFFTTERAERLIWYWLNQDWKCKFNIRCMKLCIYDAIIFNTCTIAHLKNRSPGSFCIVECMPSQNQIYFQLNLFHDSISFQTPASKTR